MSYHVVSDGGAKAFLKALDYSEALDAPDPARVLQSLTDAYNFERDLLAKCVTGRMHRVVRAIADGTIRVSGSPFPVQYLILELADGDVRQHLAAVKRIDVAWKLRALHHIATGLWQLHKVGIAHQDMKPSNALVFNAKETKVGDLGRAAYKGHKAPSDDYPCAGDPAYAPPELLYNHLPADWGRRRFGCDLYLLGSMVVFLFSGASMTSLLLTEMPVGEPGLEPLGMYCHTCATRSTERFNGSMIALMSGFGASFPKLFGSSANQIPSCADIPRIVR